MKISILTIEKKESLLSKKVVPIDRMEELISKKFLDSSLNLTLKRSNEFISAFPGEIVFGTCSFEGYKKNKYFEISVFELHSFYITIVEIIKKLSNGLVLEKTIFCTKGHFKYLYEILHSQTTNEPNVCFSIQKDNQNIVYQLLNNEAQLNTLLFALVKVIPATLCFSSIEFQVFSNASKQTVKDIVSFQEELKCSDFLIKFLKESQREKMCSINNLTTFLNYYCEIILVHHNLNILIDTISTVQNHFDNIASIISIETQ